MIRLFFEEQTAIFLMFYDRYIKTASSDKARVHNWAGLPLIHSFLSLILSVTAPFAQYAAEIFLVIPYSPLSKQLFRFINKVGDRTFGG
jgi:hypothetical protein